MPSNNVETILTARDLASAKVKELRRNVASLGMKTGGPLGQAIEGISGMGLGAAAAGATIGLATIALGKMHQMLVQGVSSALAEEASLKRLDAALEANIAGWDGNREAIDKTIKARMELGFEDDVLRDSMIKLVTTTRDVEKAQRLQSIAMDVARGRGIDLSTATDMVIKANNGQIGALRRLGIAIDSTATSQEALTLLQERYAGQADAFTESTVGKLTVANTKIGELQESMGNVLLPIIADTATAFSSAADQVERFFAELGGANFKGLGGEKQLATLGASMADSIVDGFSESRFDDHIQREFNSELQTAKNHMEAQAQRAGREVAKALATGIVDSQPSLRQAWKDLINNPMDAMKEIAWIKAKMTGKKMVEGLRSTDPLQRARYQAMYSMFAAQLDDFAALGYDVGEGGGKGVNTGLKDGYTPPRLKGPYIGPAWGPGVAGYKLAFNPELNVHRNFPRRAAGGPVTEGRSYIVGERGPELFTPGRSGGITPNVGMGPIVVNVDGRELFRIMDERMGKRLALSSSNAYVRG